MTSYPHTRDEAIVDSIAGHDVRDPYRWLEDEASAEVQHWMDAQDAHARAALAAVPGLDAIAARIRELFYFDAIGAPSHYQGRYFYTRKHADKEKTIVYYRDGDNGAETLLFDPNEWSSDGSAGLGGYWPSHDGTRVAYSVKEHNSDETVTRVFDIATRANLADELTGTKYSGASWGRDGTGFYYTYVPPIGGDVTVAERPGFAELRYHAIGAAQAADVVVRGATRDPQSFLGGGISRDGHWLMAQVQHGWSSSDVYFRDARHADSEWRTLVAGVDANVSVQIWRDVFYVTTDDGAPRNRVFAVDPATPARADWREIVAESPDATLESASVVGEHLVLTYLRDAASELEIRTLAGAPVRTVALPPLGSTGGIHGNEDEDTGYLAYTSFTEPSVIHEISIATGAAREWARVNLPFARADLVAEQVFFPSADGTRISMFVIHHRDAVRDGTNPTILYGYGGFNVNLTPGFAGSRVAWLERGGVYAIPNLRGGGEYGEAWHRAGMLDRKQNVFDDFIAAADYLVRERWTSPRHLAISGGSNGGLLVGAVMAQRPELCRAVICAVPLLDMLRYDKFGSGKTWVPEYGSADDPAQAPYLWAYSPYRIAIDAGTRAYPAVLFDSADHDDRVDPMHARKLAAVLQRQQTADLPILLRIERNAGHGGADLVKQQVDRVATQLAFLLHYLR
jgi:prolyl oligopeptidase|nr:prolyl oligopeptidase family serine peptidase [Kofleriaceae bacterium]